MLLSGKPFYYGGLPDFFISFSGNFKTFWLILFYSELNCLFLRLNKITNKKTMIKITFP